MESDSEVDRPVQKTQEPKSRRPPNSAFRQQRLKSWQPILTPRTVLPLFFGVAALFALFGGLLIYASSVVHEVIIDYTLCNSTATSSFTTMASDDVSYNFRKGTEMAYTPQWKVSGSVDDDTRTCDIKFNIPEDMGAPVYLFYRLTNFYQNHRRYVLSFNEDQLNGDAKSASDLNNADDCKPLITNSEGKPYYPCGLIANSMFNDTFSSLVGEDGTATYNMTNSGIAWSTDKNRFKKTSYKASEVVPPRNWVKKYPNGYTDENLPDISTWEEFQNWMRTAGLPTFSKLALRNDDDTLKAGNYTISIGLNFNTTLYDGKKSILLSTRSVIGGRNPFLGIAYCVVAGVCGLLGVLFLAHHLINPRRLGDHTYLSWNQDDSRAASNQ